MRSNTKIYGTTWRVTFFRQNSVLRESHGDEAAKIYTNSLAYL